jgi:hypothetical protein
MPGCRLRRGFAAVVKRRTAIFQRLDAQLELLGPAWYDALGANYGKAALAVLARYGDPTTLLTGLPKFVGIFGPGRGRFRR